MRVTSNEIYIERISIKLSTNYIEFIGLELREIKEFSQEEILRCPLKFFFLKHFKKLVIFFIPHATKT